MSLLPSGLIGFATQGSASDDERRLLTLLGSIESKILPFDREHKLKTFYTLTRTLLQTRPDFAVMEGTGIAGGAALLLARLLTGQRYVVSSGDAVGPFVGAHYRALGALFLAYEKALYRNAVGFVGWSPYMTGRALTFGVPRAMTAAGWAPFKLSLDEQACARSEVRSELGIGDVTIVVGICGSLAWTSSVGYCYGYELVRSLGKLARTDLRILVVGDGSGRAHLEAAVPRGWKAHVHLTGRVPREAVPRYLAAMDAASLPQSLDQVGSFRYTTKLSEYLAARLPVITGQIPLSYDLPGDWFWRLEGDSPWDERYVEALTSMLSTLTVEAIAQRRSQVPESLPEFELDRQVSRFAQFLTDLVNDGGP